MLLYRAPFLFQRWFQDRSEEVQNFMLAFFTMVVVWVGGGLSGYFIVYYGFDDLAILWLAATILVSQCLVPEKLVPEIPFVNMITLMGLVFTSTRTVMGMRSGDTGACLFMAGFFTFIGAIIASNK